MGFSDLLLGKKKLDSQQEKGHKAPEKVAEKSSLFGSLRSAIREKIHGIIPKKEVEEEAPLLDLSSFEVLISTNIQTIIDQASKRSDTPEEAKEYFQAQYAELSSKTNAADARIALLRMMDLDHHLLPISQETSDKIRSMLIEDKEIEAAVHTLRNEEVALEIPVPTMQEKEQVHIPEKEVQMEKPSFLKKAIAWCKEKTKKEIETVISKEVSPALSLKQLRSFSPEFIVKTFVIDPKLKEQCLAELSYNIEHNGMEKAQIMLLYQLFKNSILPIREEEKEHLTQLFRGDSSLDQTSTSVDELTENAQAGQDGKDEILVGAGVMEVKEEQDKHSPITAPKPLDRDQLILKNTFMLQDTPMLSLHDTDKVPYIIAEYVTDKNDIGNFRKLLKNTPSDSLARATHLKNLLYGLRAAGIINLQEIDTKIPTLQKSIETVFTEHADISVSKHGDSAPEALDALSLLQKDFLQEDDKRYYALDIQEPFSMEIRKKFLQDVYSYLDSTQILNFKKEITELARSQGQSKQQQDIFKDLDSRMKAKEDTRNALAKSISYLTEKLLITPDTDPAIIATIDGHIRTIKEYCMPVIDMEKAFPKELKSFTYEEVKELENNGTITLKNFSLPNEEK